MGEITAPEPLSITHEVKEFTCGNLTLDDWLIRRALKNQDSGASKTFVICESNRKVVGYYALATGSVERNLVSGNFSRGMPEPIPVIVLGRLAVDQSCQGKRLGAALLKDALLRAVSVSGNVGLRGILVHAISEEAKRLNLQYGFQESPQEPMTLLISIKNILKHI